MRYLIPKGGLVEPLVKRIVVETLFWEFLGLFQTLYLSHCMSLWGDFLSFYFWFYEVTILENTYATDEGKKIQMYF
jgi:hypothetical protein